MTMTRPNFLIVGAPKSGTTTLYNALVKHPDVYMSYPKEQHFFDYNYAKGVQAYLQDAFSGWSGEKAIGEATPHYLFPPYVPERIKSVFPDVKLIAVLRNPIDRAYADWWMYYSRDRDSLSFDDAIDVNMRRLATGPMFAGDRAEELWRVYYRESCVGGIDRRPYVEIGYYDEQISRYWKYFPKEQLRILFAEDLRHDFEGTVRDVWQFLGVDPNHEIVLADDEQNEALGSLAKPLFRAVRLTGTSRVIQLLPRSIKSRVKSITRYKSRPSMGTQVRRMLAVHYRPHVQRLSEMVERNLDHWLVLDE